MLALRPVAALTLLAAALAPPAPSSAQLRVWTDSAGNVHATDDAAKIPKGTQVEERESTAEKFDTHEERVAAFGRPPVHQTSIRIGGPARPLSLPATLIPVFSRP